MVADTLTHISLSKKTLTTPKKSSEKLQNLQT